MHENFKTNFSKIHQPVKTTTRREILINDHTKLDHYSHK